jgi:hypothetical protein
MLTCLGELSGFCLRAKLFAYTRPPFRAGANANREHIRAS